MEWNAHIHTIHGNGPSCECEHGINDIWDPKELEMTTPLSYAYVLATDLHKLRLQTHQTEG